MKLAGKSAAAWIAQSVFHLSKHERQLVFGLSHATAAGTLAIATIALQMGVISEEVLNASVLMILVLCTTSSFITEHAAKDLDTWAKMLPPTPGFEEQCYSHTFEKEAKASIYNPDINKGLTISFDKDVLDHFTQWKMMGVRDYVMGLEPGNCHPDGRDVMRKEGKLQFLQPGESCTFCVDIECYER